MTSQKTEGCGKCNAKLEAIGTEHDVLEACRQFRQDHNHYIVAWVCYQHDMGVKIEAIYANELDALRHAVGTGYLKVAPVEAGEIGSSLP